MIAEKFEKLLPQALVLICHADIVSVFTAVGLVDDGVVGPRSYRWVETRVSTKVSSNEERVARYVHACDHGELVLGGQR